MCLYQREVGSTSEVPHSMLEFNEIKSFLCLPPAVFDDFVNYKKMPLGFRKDDLPVSVKSAVSPKRSETEEETQDSMITTFFPDIFLVHFLSLSI